jgi:L-arginine dehydrogenase
VAREHLRFVAGLREWTDVRMYSPQVAVAAERQEVVRRAVPEQSQISFSTSARSAVEGADVVLLCTSSGSSVIERPWVAESALVTSISTNSPGAHEIEPASLGSYDVYCDYRATAPVTAGEMTIAVEAGEWSGDRIIADLAELATGAAPKEWTRPRFFRSTGLGIEDLAIAHLLVS